MSKFDDAVQAPEAVGIATLYGQLKTVAWQLLDTTSMVSNSMHRSAATLDKQNETWARVKYAQLDKAADKALAELDE